MMQARGSIVASAILLGMFALSGCGTSATGGADPGSGQFNPPDLKMQQKIGEGEGQLNVLAWPGYAEDGSTDPKVDWVSSFEKQTGCQTNVKVFGTSDEAVNLMQTGEYDVVSASGDASLRLVAAGDVEPVNTDLVSTYKDLAPFLKDRAWNTVDGVNYGIPHGWGANLLMWRKDIIKQAPNSWGAVFDAKAPYAGKVTAYDSPIYIADAALYLMKHNPELGIKDPYALDQKQLQAAQDLLEKQNAAVGEYWSDYLKEIQAFKTGSTVIGTTWQVIANLAKESAPVGVTLPSEGATGWSDTWMVGSQSEHPNCAYMWLNHITSPQVQAQVAEYFGEAPANTKACSFTTDPKHCQTYHAQDAKYAAKIEYWTTPISQCLDGRKVQCTDYADWTEAWTEIKG
jgi:putative spermidine/putrescine transport system substrate-binding protein